MCVHANPPLDPPFFLVPREEEKKTETPTGNLSNCEARLAKNPNANTLEKVGEKKKYIFALVL